MLKYSGMFSKKHNEGYVLLIMLLLIVVLGALVWLNPGAMFKKKGKEMPWNQTRRIVPKDKTVPQPNSNQPVIGQYLGLTAKCLENEQDRGVVKIVLSPDGRVQGMWKADYFPKKELRYEVVSASFEGNIDPSYVYKTDSGTDATRLYVITKGYFVIMETWEKSGRMRTSEGRIYMTGWVGTNYNFDGKIIITSDNKNYYEYSFSGPLTPDIPMIMTGNPKTNILQFLPR